MRSVRRQMIAPLASVALQEEYDNLVKRCCSVVENKMRELPPNQKVRRVWPLAPFPFSEP